MCVCANASRQTDRNLLFSFSPYPRTPSLPLDPLMRCDLSVGGPDCLSSFVLSFHPFLRSYLSALLQSIGLRALSVMVRDNTGSFDWTMCVLECVRESMCNPGTLHPLFPMKGKKRTENELLASSSSNCKVGQVANRVFWLYRNPLFPSRRLCLLLNLIMMELLLAGVRVENVKVVRCLLEGRWSQQYSRSLW